mgnify:CR=1 FL=1
MSCRQLSMLLSLKLPILVALLSPTTSSPLLLCFKLTMVCCVVEPDDVFLTVVAEYEVDNAFVAQLSPTTSSFVASRL